MHKNGLAFGSSYMTHIQKPKAKSQGRAQPLLNIAHLTTCFVGSTIVQRRFTLTTVVLLSFDSGYPAVAVVQHLFIYNNALDAFGLYQLARLVWTITQSWSRRPVNSRRLRAASHPSSLNVSCVACADTSVLACLDDEAEKYLPDSDLDGTRNRTVLIFNACTSEDLSDGLCPQTCGTVFNGTLVSSH